MTAAAAQPGVRSAVERGSKARRSHLQSMIDLPEAVRRACGSEFYRGSHDPEALRAWVRRLIEGIDDPDLVDTEGPRTLIHPSTHPALSTPPTKMMTEGLAELPEGKRNRVATKLQALRDLEAFGKSRRLLKTAARTRFAEQYREHYTYRGGGRTRVLRVTKDSLQRWQRAYDRGGVEALARDGRGRWGRQGPSPEAVDFYLARRNDPRSFTVDKAKKAGKKTKKAGKKKRKAARR